MREQTIQAILDHKIIAIVRGVDSESIVDTAKALYEGGIRLVEVTFNQSLSVSVLSSASLPSPAPAALPP